MYQDGLKNTASTAISAESSLMRERDRTLIPSITTTGELFVLNVWKNKRRRQPMKTRNKKIEPKMAEKTKTTEIKTIVRELLLLLKEEQGKKPTAKTSLRTKALKDAIGIVHNSERLKETIVEPEPTDSEWTCPDCGYTTLWSWANVADSGTPVCPTCDCDLELIKG